MIEVTYLTPTKYARLDHSEIIMYVRKLTSGLSKAYAIKSIYLFVKSYIKWTIEKVKTSIDILKSRKDICFSKVSLQIALPRAVDIPARYRLEEADTKVLKPYLSPDIYSLFLKTIIHVLAEVQVDGKWLDCDAILDPLLSHISWRREWNKDLDLSCIPSIFKIRIIGSCPDLPIDMALSPIKEVKEIAERQDVLSRINEHLERIRAMSPDDKLEHFMEHWGSDIVATLRSTRLR